MSLFVFYRLWHLVTTFVGHLVSQRMESFACLCFTCIFDIAFLFILQLRAFFSSLPSQTLMRLISRMGKISYIIIIGRMYVLNPMSLMCHLILGG